MKIQITALFSGSVLFEHEAERNTVALTLVAAVKAGANLDGANLYGANLDGASLVGAKLVGANLVGAGLVGANLTDARLDAANLTDALLDGAKLDGASLVGANLDGEILNKAPITLLNLHWPVMITSQYMRIGCQRHTHKEWGAFTNIEIKSMAPGAISFWRKWKAPLLALCDINHEVLVATDPASKQSEEAES